LKDYADLYDFMKKYREVGYTLAGSPDEKAPGLLWRWQLQIPPSDQALRRPPKTLSTVRCS